MSENQSPYTGASEPSDEAIQAATEALYLRLDATKAEGRIVAKTTDEVAKGALVAAYPIDMPRAVAEAHAAGRREQLDEILAWLRSPEEDMRVESRRITTASEIVARFSEAPDA